MRIGIFAKTFAGDDPRGVLRAARAAGFDTVQFNMACAGLSSLPHEVPHAVIAAIDGARRETGVAIAAISATYNMIHPDEAVRAAGLAALEAILGAARALGVPLVTLCTGTRDAEDQWRHHPGNASEEAWRDLRREMAKAIALAEGAGVDLGVEPELANVVSSARAAARLLAEMASPRLRIVLDPANLFETEPDHGRIIEDAAALLGRHVAMAHAKDRDARGGFVAAGGGVIDFRRFLATLRAQGFDGPVVTHGLSADEAPGVAQFLQSITKDLT